MANIANKPNRCNNDAVFDSLVAGVQSHNDRSKFLSIDVPEAAREEIVDHTVDNFHSDCEVGGASPAFPPSMLMDAAPSQNAMRKTNMAAPIDEDQDHVHWKKLFFQNQQIINQLMLKRPLVVNTAEQPVSKRHKIANDPNEIMSDSGTEDTLDDLISKVQREKDGEKEEEEQEDNFLESLEEFMIKDDRTGPALSAELAKVLNTNFQVRPSEEKAKTLCEKHHRPENCTNMTVPRINEEIWPSLKKKSQSIDFKIQKSQNIVLKALTPACRLLDKLISARKSKTSGFKDTDECLELAQDTVKLLQLAFTDLSHKRRYLIRPELKQSYKPLCNDSNKVTEFLFGDNVDEKIKKNDTSKRVNKKLQGYNFQPSSTGKSQGIHKSHGSGYRFGWKTQPPHGNYPQSSYKYDQNNNGSFLGKGRGRRPPPTQQKK